MPLSSSISHSSVSSSPVERKTGVCYVERVNAPQSLSAEQTPRSAAEAREDCLRHCPPRRFTVRGFVGGGYTPSLLAQSVYQVAVCPASQPASQPSSLTASLSRLLRSEPCIYSEVQSGYVVIPLICHCHHIQQDDVVSQIHVSAESHEDLMIAALCDNSQNFSN